jgi:DNA-binding MarR family transcriptional regulator
MAGTQASDSEGSRCNCLALRQAARHVSQIYDRRLAIVGLKGSQYSILNKLGRVGSISMNDLAKLMVMDRTTVGRAVRPLERDGLLKMKPGEDGRVRKLSLTPGGARLLADANVEWQKAQSEVESAFGEASSAELRRTLTRLIESTS